MSTAQIQGFTSTNIAEVDANTKALRTSLRSEDYGALGVYSLGSASGVMGAGLGSNAPIFAFRYGGANLAIVKRVTISAAAITAFTAGIARFDLLVARGFTVSDTGGTSITPATNSNKLRTTMGTTGISDARISSTGTLTAGTRTLDANPIGSIIGGVLVTAGTGIIVPDAKLFDVRPGEFPLVLAQNEGVVIQATVPATGTWTFAARIEWAELTSY